MVLQDGLLRLAEGGFQPGSSIRRMASRWRWGTVMVTRQLASWLWGWIRQVISSVLRPVSLSEYSRANLALPSGSGGNWSSMK